ncbi:MAG: protein phosphatase 2C domain-containing protein [Polyangiales bacterium]
MSEEDPTGGNPSSDMQAALAAAAEQFGNGIDEPTMPNKIDQAIARGEGPIRFRYYGHTDVGLVREHNEDNFLVADLGTDVRGMASDAIVEGVLGKRGIVLAVCDGMGGAAAGEVASQMAVDTLYELFRAGEADPDRDTFARRLVHSIEEAGSRIFSAAKMDRSRRGMGTTSTVAGLLDKVLFVGQVGDSRCYVLRNGQLSLISKDQSLVNQLIEAGQLTEEEAEAFEHSNIILQALGTTEKVVVDLTFLELRQGDRLMLCSDGLSGLVHPEVIREVLATTPDLRDCCTKLIEMANNGGGHDNITCICAEFGGEGLLPAENAPPATYQQYPLPIDEHAAESGEPRDVHMKSGAPKPGSDVKRSGSRTMEHVAPAPDLPVARFPWWFVVVVVFVLIGIGIVAWRLEPPEDTSRSDVRRPVNAPSTLQPSGPPVEVMVRTDAPSGELFVNGQTYGDITSDEDVLIELPPGSYRLELRREDNVLATATVMVRAGSPLTVMLELPEGSDDEPTDEEEPAPVPPPRAPAAPPAVPTGTTTTPTPGGTTTMASSTTGAAAAPSTTTMAAPATSTMAADATAPTPTAPAPAPTMEPAPAPEPAPATP